MPTFTHDGVEIYYEDSAIEKPAVVFSHGFLMDHQMFDAQVFALSGDYRCITWDQRGHGQTRATGRFTYWDSAADLVALLDHLGIDRAALVGMSQGGFVSMRVALGTPARVRALAFIDSQAGLEDADKMPLYDQLFEQWSTGGPTPEITELVAGIILGPDVPSDLWTRRWLESDLEQISHSYRTLVDRDDLWDRLGEIQAPALVMQGHMDLAISMDKAERLAASLPNADEVVVIPGAGHAANLGNPDAVNEALAAFLRRHR